MHSSEPLQTDEQELGDQLEPTALYMEDPPGSIDDKDEWQERVREIRASQYKMMIYIYLYITGFKPFEAINPARQNYLFVSLHVMTR